MNTTEVLNTPGYYYAIAYALSVLVITCTNERKIGRWKLAAVSCVQFALLFIFYDSNRWSTEGTVSSINGRYRRAYSGRHLYLQ